MASGTLLPSPWQYAYDANGDPVPGAKASFTAAGTSTPINTYADVALTIPNANPVIADSAGIYGPIYLTPGLSYKLTLTTSADVLIRTQDNIPAPLSSLTTLARTDGRLTLLSGTPVPPTDVTAATTVYYTPYVGNQIDLYAAGVWQPVVFVETALALGTLTATTCYDVFGYAASGALALEKLAWTTATTRATAVVYQEGRAIKAGDPTRHYLGTFYPTSTTTTADSLTKRFLYNGYHRRRRPFLRQEATATWTYTTATIRQANANAANQVECVVGAWESPIHIQLAADARNTNALVSVAVLIGEDATTAGAAEQVRHLLSTPAANVTIPMTATLIKLPTIGYHKYTWLEYSEATGTTTWAGAAPAGMTGWVEG